MCTAWNNMFHSMISSASDPAPSGARVHVRTFGASTAGFAASGTDAYVAVPRLEKSPRPCTPWQFEQQRATTMPLSEPWTRCCFGSFVFKNRAIVGLWCRRQTHRHPHLHHHQQPATVAAAATSSSSNSSSSCSRSTATTSTNINIPPPPTQITTSPPPLPRTTQQHTVALLNDRPSKKRELSCSQNSRCGTSASTPCSRVHVSLPCTWPRSGSGCLSLLHPRHFGVF